MLRLVLLLGSRRVLCSCWSSQVLPSIAAVFAVCVSSCDCQPRCTASQVASPSLNFSFHCSIRAPLSISGIPLHPFLGMCVLRILYPSHLILLELFSGSLVLGLCTCWSSSPDKFPSWASRLSYGHAVKNLLLSPTLLYSWLYSGTKMIGVSNQSTYNLRPATHATKTLWDPFKAHSS